MSYVYLKVYICAVYLIYSKKDFFMVSRSIVSSSKPMLMLEVRMKPYEINSFMKLQLQVFLQLKQLKIKLFP